MRKRLCSILLSICMVLTMAPMAFAVDDTDIDHVFEVGTKDEFDTAVNKINSASDGSFVIKLTDNISLAGEDAKLTKNTTTILGEGYEISGGNNTTLKISGTALVNLGQSDYDQSLTFNGATTYHSGPLVTVVGNGQLNMYPNVTLTGQSTFGSDAGVSLGDNATFNMFGGTIENCKDTFSGTTGGVGVGSASDDSTDTCTFNMSGGTINNCSGGYGGGVRLGKGASMTMSGGEITNCSATWGGGIYATQAPQLRITNGEISNNKATYGGGVAVSYMKKGFWTSYELNIQGGKISNNTATSYGGGIMMYNSNTASKVTNCTIVGNQAQIGGGIMLMNNSSADFSGNGNIICNNTVTSGAADIFLNTADDSIKLFAASTMNKEFRDSGKTIDGWYNDDPTYVPSEDATPIDVSTKLTGELALVASYKVVPLPVLTYHLSDTDTDAYATYTIDADTAHKVISAPARDGYVFTGWSDGTNTYYAGQDITPDSDMTLTAQWQAVEDWSEKPSEDNDGKLDVDVDVNVNVDVAVDAGVSAEVSNAQKSDLSDRVREALATVLNGNTPIGMTKDQAFDLRTLMNKGASSINAQLTVYAALENTPTEDELKTLLGDQFVSGEAAQKWNLTVKLTTIAKNGTTEIGKVEDVSITETSPITFTLTTGQDLSGKDIRVLYIHNGAVESAESSVTDAANGVVSVTASKFSPYIILSKTRASSGGSHSSSSGSTATYPVKVADKNPTGGAVSADKSSAAKGATVTVTVTPDKGYELDKLTVTDKDGNAVSLTAKGSGKYTFTMPAGQVTIAASFAESDWTLSYRSCPKDKTCPIDPFTDAKNTDWYHDGVHFCLENKLMVGYGGNLFKPEDGTSRAMIAVMLWRLNGSPAAKTDVSFDDVGDGTWYTDAVRWATSEGIAQGYGNGKFGPNDTMTREQMVTILYRYAKASGYDVSVGEDTNILSYTDAASVAQYAIPAMQWACGSGMVQGSGNALLPQGSTTRAQMATMMMRFCAEIVK